MMTDYIPITVEDGESGGLLGTWWRQPPHVIQPERFAPYRSEGVRPVASIGDVLAPTGTRTIQYEPMAETNLLNALLDVAQRKIKPIEFANRFGLLGYNYLVPTENRCKGGDPLNWFIAQAQTVYTATELIARVQEAQESTGGRLHLVNYLREEITDGPYALGGRVSRIARPGFRNPILVANGFLRYLINANLGDTGRRLQSTESGIRTIFTFRALVQVIYWQLADQLGKSSIHRCVECGRIFTHSNIRARFCPPVGSKKISSCKSRWNVREFRRKKQRRRKR
jgi:hypothetical protein